MRESCDSAAPLPLALGCSALGIRSVWLPVLTGLCLAVIELSSGALRWFTCNLFVSAFNVAQRERPGPTPTIFEPSAKCMLCAAVDLHKQGFCRSLCGNLHILFSPSHCCWTCHPNKGWVIRLKWVRSCELGCQDWIADSDTNVISGSKGSVCFLP